MKLALCLIVAPTDDEANYLQGALTSAAQHVDEIFITITGKNKNVENVAKAFNANISYFDWCKDFAKARNFNFSQVPKEFEFIFWMDADDGVRGLQGIKKVIEQNKDVDIFSMNYLYAFDEHNNPIVVHPKSRIIRNDGCVEWQGYLHEDFKENREVVVKMLQDVEIIHLTTEKSVEKNKTRNLEIAKYQMEEFKDDPRSYWNVGNASKSAGYNEEALDAFTKFLDLSQSDDEKYIVRLRMAECYWAMGKKTKALDEARHAIGTKPQYPDAYHLAGSLYLELSNYDKALESYAVGLSKKPPYHKIIVYNPRDYDYVPLKNMAKAYFELNLPSLALVCLKGCLKISPKDEGMKKLIKTMEKESKKFNKVVAEVERLSKIKSDKKLWDELNKVDDKYKSHPAICNLRNTRFVKEKSSGKDLVFYCGLTSEEWTPQTAKTKGIGGSEEAIIHLAKGLSERGWNVTVYNNCGSKEQVFNGVTYKPYWSWNYRDKQDVTVLWRNPKAAGYEINSDKVYVDLHDVVQEGEFNEARLKFIDKIFVKSEFHKSLFPKLKDKIVVIPNGIEASSFSGEYKKEKLLINTSSPDRSLRMLTELFPEVKKQVPDAKCVWAYGWNVFDTVHGDTPNVMEWKDKVVKGMKESGIENLGRVSHGEVAKLYQRGTVFAYPSEFAEIDCISLTKAMAAGCIPVTTDFAAMGDKSGHGGIFLPSKKTAKDWCGPYQHDFSMSDELKKQWVDATVKALKEQEDPTEMREWALKEFNWDSIVNRWNKEI